MKTIAAVAATLTLSAPAWGQHTHVVPHTTTHSHTVQHGNHHHHVPHTTTHYDVVTHPAPPIYVAPPPPVYVAPPAPVYAAPPPVVANYAPAYQPAALPANAPPPYAGPGVTVWLPKALGGTISYRLDGASDEELRAGYQHSMRAKATYTIEFDRGVGNGSARYVLKEGSYKFTHSEEAGWDIARVADDGTAVASNGGLRRNSPPPRRAVEAPEPQPEVVPVSGVR